MVEGVSVGRALHVALPARLNMDPEDLQRIRDGLFPGAPSPSSRLAHARGGREGEEGGPRLITVVLPTEEEQARLVSEGPAAAIEAGDGGTVRASQDALVDRSPLSTRNLWRKQGHHPIKPPAPLRQPPSPRGSMATPPRYPLSPIPVVPAGLRNVSMCPLVPIPPLPEGLEKQLFTGRYSRMRSSSAPATTPLLQPACSQRRTLMLPLAIPRHFPPPVHSSIHPPLPLKAAASERVSPPLASWFIPPALTAPTSRFAACCWARGAPWGSQPTLR
jgi:hypothetical protein